MMRLPWKKGTLSEERGLGRRVWEDPWASFEAWAPSVDVLDGEEELTVHAEVPGMDAKDVEVTVHGRTLTLSGEKSREKEEERKGVWRSERSYGAFRRDIELPAEVDPDHVTAELARGLLTVRVAKAKSAQAKRIPVKPS